MNLDEIAEYEGFPSIEDTYWAVDKVMYWDVTAVLNRVRAVSEAVARAVDDAVDNAVFWAVDDAVSRAVDDAVGEAFKRFQDA